MTWEDEQPGYVPPEHAGSGTGGEKPPRDIFFLLWLGFIWRFVAWCLAIFFGGGLMLALAAGTQAALHNLGHEELRGMIDP